MNTQENASPTMPVSILYDAACPVCQFGISHYRSDSSFGEARCVDARQESDFKKRAAGQGLNIDKGMVVEHGGRLYHGAQAMHRMALASDRAGIYNRLLYYAFRSRVRSMIFYPLFKSARRLALLLKGVPLIEKQNAIHKQSTIKRQLGKDWSALHPAIQARFEKDPTAYEQIFYRGTMQRIERSRLGTWFAFLTAPLGHPLAPYSGDDVRLDVLLYRKQHRPGVYWRRTYYYTGRTPYTVTSVKCESAKGDMLECVGGGFGMVLKLSVESGNLHFRSTRYFWRIAGLRIPLPHLLTPGQTHVAHEEIGDGSFRFIISMDHPYLGRTFYQQGIFKEVKVWN